MQIPLKSTRRSSRTRKSWAEEGIAKVVADETGGIAPPQLPATATLSPAAAAAKLADPVMGADEVVWYVRPASGGQFGPAKTNILRVWLDEGRVGTDTLVWREGWRDWREAGDVFPQLYSRPMVPTLDIALADPTPLPSPNYSLEQANRARDSRNFLVVAATAIVITLLLVILALVLTIK